MMVVAIVYLKLMIPHKGYMKFCIIYFCIRDEIIERRMKIPGNKVCSVTPYIYQAHDNLFNSMGMPC